jgi:hypothetical protein
MERPTAVSAFGILNLAKGALGIIGLLWTPLFFSGAAAANNPAIKIMAENPTYMKLIKMMTPVGIIVSGVLLATGVGLLKLKPWARKLSIGYAIYAIIFVPIYVGINFMFVYRPWIEEARQLQGPEAVAMTAGAVGGTVGGILGLVYPVLLWIFMTRPKVVAAFQLPPPLPANIA